MSLRGRRREERSLAREHGPKAASGLVKIRSGRAVDVTPREFVAMVREGLDPAMPTVEEFVASVRGGRRFDAGGDRAASALVRHASSGGAVISRCADCGLELRPFLRDEEGGVWMCWCGWMQSSPAGGCAELCMEARWNDIGGYRDYRDVARSGGYEVPEDPPPAPARNSRDDRRRERAARRGDPRALEAAIRRGEFPPWRDERFERLARAAIDNCGGLRLEASFGANGDPDAVFVNEGEDWRVAFPSPGDDRLMAFAAVVSTDGGGGMPSWYCLSFLRSEPNGADDGRRVICDRYSARHMGEFRRWVKDHHPLVPTWVGGVESGRIATRGRDDGQAR